ncbi:hypothetical protein CWS02_08175 [Enterobacter sp. EA-1]|nr:hypothetical protein CWS02_08175 [Enterobacter sp. EA-1]
MAGGFAPEGASPAFKRFNHLIKIAAGFLADRRYRFRYRRLIPVLIITCISFSFTTRWVGQRLFHRRVP